MRQKNLLKETFLAILVSVVVTVLFLTVMSFLMLKLGFGDKLAQKLMLIGYVLAPAAGGFLLGKKRKQSRFLWGLMVGGIYFLVYFLVAICALNVHVSELLWVAIPICLGGMAGGMLA